MILVNTPESSLKYIELQCNNKIEDYSNCNELTSLTDFLSKLKSKNVLELGAGLGRISVFLKNKFKWDDTNFFLLDGDSGDIQVNGVHRTTNKDFYNSLDSTKKFCLTNGIKEDHLFLINAEKDFKLPDNKFDLCYSCKAIGFHWPINEYLDIIQHAMLKNSYLFFELRSIGAKNRTAAQEAVAKNFNDHQIQSINKEIYKIISLKMDADCSIILLQKRV